MQDPATLVWRGDAASQLPVTTWRPWAKYSLRFVCNCHCFFVQYCSMWRVCVCAWLHSDFRTICIHRAQSLKSSGQYENGSTTDQLSVLYSVTDMLFQCLTVAAIVIRHGQDAISSKIFRWIFSKHWQLIRFKHSQCLSGRWKYK